MKEPRKLAEDLVREMARLFPGDLRGALLYGSVPRGEYIDGVSNVNILVLFEDISPATFERAAPLARRWSASGVLPMLLEREDWTRASDVFAIEIADMLAAHELLHGVDPLAGLTVADDALRLQAERELRGKLIALHGAMLRVAGSPDGLGQLLTGALPSITTYLRAALRLGGRTVPLDSRHAIEAAGDLVGFDPAGLGVALAERQRHNRWKVDITDPLVEHYHTAIEKTADYVDRIGGSS